MGNRSSGRQLLLVMAVLVAGCSGFSSDAGPTGTVTPAPVPSHTTSPVWQEPTEGPERARWLNDTGTIDLVMLGRVHYRTVFSTTYTYRDVQRITAANGSILTETEMITAHGKSSQRITVRRYDHRTQQQVEWDYFIPNNEIVVERSQLENRTIYRQLSHRQLYRQLESLPDRELLISHLMAGTRGEVDPQLRWLRETNETGHYHLFASRLIRPDRFNAIDQADEPRNLSLRVEVDSAGFIRSYRLAYAAQTDTGHVRVERTVTYSSVGSTTVERPAWYERAIANGTSDSS